MLCARGVDKQKRNIGPRVQEAVGWNSSPLHLLLAVGVRAHVEEQVVPIMGHYVFNFPLL